MKVVRKGNIAVGAFEFPDRKKIALGIKTGNEVTVYGYFQSRLGANAFVEDLAVFVGMKPEERRGRWIPTEYDSFADGAPVWDKWECSECGHEHNGEEDTLTAFCPDCGSRMDGGD